MYVATNRIIVQKGHGPDLERRFAGEREVFGQTGFLRFELWRLVEAEEHEEYLVVTHWRSREAHAAWQRSESFRRAHAGGRPGFVIASSPAGYEVRLHREA